MRKRLCGNLSLVKGEKSSDVLASSLLAKIWGECCSTIHSPPALFFFFFWKWRLARTHYLHSLGQDQSTVAQRAETTEVLCRPWITPLLSSLDVLSIVACPELVWFSFWVCCSCCLMHWQLGLSRPVKNVVLMFAEGNNEALRPQKPLRLIRDGEVEGSGSFILNTYSLHCHPEWLCIKVGSCVSHFNVSLTVWAKSRDSVHKNSFFWRERRAEADRAEVLLLTSQAPYR